MKARFLLPLAIFLVIAGFFVRGLFLNPREVPSVLKGKPAPVFQLEQLGDATKTLSPGDMKGKVWLLNVWSSWCVSCREEHPMLLALASRNLVPIIGLNYKEVRGDGGIDASGLTPPQEVQLARERANRWLAEHGGNPYAASVLDLDGRVGIDYGVYGVPETFVIDKNGVIREKHIGPITKDALEGKILPLVEKLQQS